MKNLDTNTLYEIGVYLTDKLNINKDKLKDVILTLCVDESYFKKIDEDIFYRINSSNDEKKEFIPSENEIKLTFPNNTIIIKKCAVN